MSEASQSQSQVTGDDQASTRAHLRKLSQQLDDRRHEFTSTNSTGLAEVQQKANQLFETSKTEARGTALDAQVLHKVSALGAEQAGNLDKAGESYIRILKSKFGFVTHPHVTSPAHARTELHSQRSRHWCNTPSRRISGSSGKINWQRLGDVIEKCGVYSRAPAITFARTEAKWNKHAVCACRRAPLASGR